jgi:hypothetical protein
MVFPSREVSGTTRAEVRVGMLLHSDYGK